jgi:lipopolysaccharide transport system ATP-binding protein
MSKTVIKVESVSKQYRLGKIGTGSFKHDLNRWWHAIRGQEDPYLKIGDVNNRAVKSESEYVWALKDISFDLQQGDVVGIIGRNGAGKSTLLKILSRTTTPTTGSIKIKGRIASLLEVGTGFHPELTGKENIFLNGAILGMRKKEIQAKFDEIVDFSGVEKYIDTPVKRYSSGMYVRLAFAVAAHLEPEILIVDEVLAVGDAEFQRKALGKMNDVSRGEGRTVLFVSHNIAAIRQLCQKGILLNNGRVESIGSVEEVIKNYFLRGHELRVKPPLHTFRRSESNNSPVKIEDIFVRGNENAIPKIALGSGLEIVIRIHVTEPIANANVAISFYNSEAINTGMAFSWDDNFFLTAERGLHDIIFKLRGPVLSPGDYSIGVGLNQSTQTMAWDGIGYYPIFTIENQNNVAHFAGRTWGITHLVGNTWEISKIKDA